MLEYHKQKTTQVKFNFCSNMYSILVCIQSLLQVILLLKVMSQTENYISNNYLLILGACVLVSIQSSPRSEVT